MISHHERCSKNQPGQDYEYCDCAVHRLRDMRDRAEKAEARVVTMEKLVDFYGSTATEVSDARDGYCSALVDLVAAVHAHRDVLEIKEAFAKARDVLKEGPAKRSTASAKTAKSTLETYLEDRMADASGLTERDEDYWRGCRNTLEQTLLFVRAISLPLVHGEEDR